MSKQTPKPVPKPRPQEPSQAPVRFSDWAAI